MNIKKLTSKDSNSVFLVEDITPSFANTLRRLMMAEVPVLAIEDIEFKKNTSALYDEMVAHRLGLVPIKTDLKSYNLPKDCKCNGEGCAQCQLKLTLSVSKSGYAYASDLKSKDPKAKPIYPKMPIVKLLSGQKIDLEATAIMGTGLDHAKFSPCLVYYKHLPLIKIKNVSTKDAEKIVNICPKNLFESKGNKLTLKSDKITDCHLCEACSDVSNDIEISEDKSKFIFYLESWGQLSPKEIITEAADILDKKLDDFQEKIKSLK